MGMQAVLLGAAASCVVTALGAGWGDHRRTRRTDPDAVGWLDWRSVQLAAIAGALVLGTLALRA